MRAVFFSRVCVDLSLMFGVKWGQHCHWMLVWMCSIVGHDIHGVAQNPIPTLTSTWYPLDVSQKERSTAGT